MTFRVPLRRLAWKEKPRIQWLNSVPPGQVHYIKILNKKIGKIYSKIQNGTRYDGNGEFLARFGNG